MKALLRQQRLVVGVKALMETYVPFADDGDAVDWLPADIGGRRVDLDQSSRQRRLE
jgi:hypothetical protein